MITIHILVSGNEVVGEIYSRLSLNGWSNRKQWRFLKDVNKDNGHISTFIHKKSVLRKMFIEPNLDKDGYINGEVNSVLHLAGGFDIEYRIIPPVQPKINNEQTYDKKLIPKKDIMRDLSLCRGVNCPIKETCKRFKEFSILPYYLYPQWVLEPKYENGKCEMFIKCR